MAFPYAKCFERILDDLSPASTPSTSSQARAVAASYNRACTIILPTKDFRVFLILSWLQYVPLGADCIILHEADRPQIVCCCKHLTRQSVKALMLCRTILFPSISEGAPGSGSAFRVQRALAFSQLPFDRAGDILCPLRMPSVGRYEVDYTTSMSEAIEDPLRYIAEQECGQVQVLQGAYNTRTGLKALRWALCVPIQQLRCPVDTLSKRGSSVGAHQRSDCSQLLQQWLARSVLAQMQRMQMCAAFLIMAMQSLKHYSCKG